MSENFLDGALTEKDYKLKAFDTPRVLIFNRRQIVNP
jgi:hypothetical protein